MRGTRYPKGKHDQAHEEVAVTPRMIEVGARCIREEYENALVEGEFGSFDAATVARESYIAMARLIPDSPKRAQKKTREDERSA